MNLNCGSTDIKFGSLCVGLGIRYTKHTQEKIRPENDLVFNTELLYSVVGAGVRSWIQRVE